MKQDIAMLSGFVFVGSFAVFIVSILMVIVAKVRQDEAAIKSSLSLLLGSLVVGMIGFGVCSALFELHIN